MANKNIDIITMHLINNFLYSLVDEMTASVVRTSFSPLARDSFDFQCGICHANGDIILEGEGSLLHSLAYKYIIEAVKEKFGGLRFYTNYVDDQIEGMIKYAEYLAYKTCEECGSTENVTQTEGWIITLCEKCMEKRKKV